MLCRAIMNYNLRLLKGTYCANLCLFYATLLQINSEANAVILIPSYSSDSFSYFEDSDYSINKYIHVDIMSPNFNYNINIYIYIYKLSTSFLALLLKLNPTKTVVSETQWCSENWKLTTFTKLLCLSNTLRSIPVFWAEYYNFMLHCITLYFRQKECTFYSNTFIWSSFTGYISRFEEGIWVCLCKSVLNRPR